MSGKLWLDLSWAGHAYAMQACALSGQGRLEDLAQPLRWAVAMRSIAFRFEAAVSLAWTTGRQPLLPLWTSIIRWRPARCSRTGRRPRPGRTS
ncbi:hypothetical protein [Xanthomonas theicola]|uniref:hypothetical protein n=1 Tax=Xanthomonas theicola TaxID=56464 RepID=UPI001FEB0BA4|nr:hypothetical protein [Xanthomonas theicola]